MLQFPPPSGRWHIIDRLRRAAKALPFAIKAKRRLDAAVARRWGADARYAAWAARHSPGPQEWARMAAEIAAMAEPPLISVVMPVYETDPRWLGAAIRSIQAQVYPHWELCLSDDASTRADVRAMLAEAAAADGRIKVHVRPERGHISANTNSALALASGEFIALVDADDELPPDALYWIAREILAHPDVDMIFSDEDKIDAKGRRFGPYFKGDWSPALMLGQNAFSHLGVFRRALVAAAGGLREGFEGAQDHDLALRCAELTEPARIRHVPRVLYHWRALPQSTATAPEVKPYAWQAGRRAILEHLARRGITAEVEPGVGGFYQVRYARPEEWPLVSIIVPSRLGAVARRSLEALLAGSTYPRFEVLLAVGAGDAARPEAAAHLAALGGDERVRVVAYERTPFNYSWVNNHAAREARGDYLCFLNDDVTPITPGWLEEMVLRARLPGVGAVGAMLYYPDDTIQHAGVILGIGGVADHAHRHVRRGSPGYFGRAALDQDLSCVTAAAMVMPRRLFEALGGFDEALPCAFNDVDLCLRIRRAGQRILWTPQAELYHHESLTFGPHDSPERTEQFRKDVAEMRRRWAAELDADPFYNPNLSRDIRRQWQVAG
ncbi:glycosyltransferase involved in cell wall biosynthesis [Chelatococcus caeni]|uniref:Glycosyltransferase involved in cell wall biosynthesis n=3 Tax=Chelatococcus TaxID=28209 RepID=A0A840C5Z2_9HYPH|nr:MULTISPECIES: glycosyltransferase [Chelatococcus]MBB4019432.1 glycosyltransferase involved in cell wall biosynthesis [Chelatococcus caeni]